MILMPLINIFLPSFRQVSSFTGSSYKIHGMYLNEWESVEIASLHGTSLQYMSSHLSNHEN